MLSSNFPTTPNSSSIPLSGDAAAALPIHSGSLAAAPAVPAPLTPAAQNAMPDDSLTWQTMINVLHVVNGEFFSGAERVQQILGKHLNTYGFGAHFACLKPDLFPKCSELPNDQVHATPMRGRFDLRVVDQVQEVAKANKCQILHAHTPRSALVAAFAAHRMGLPWVYHVHSPTSRDSTRRLINQINTCVERFAIASCDLLITVSRSLRREMLKHRVSRKRLVYIPNGVAAIDPIDAPSRQDRTTWKLGLIALMRPRKGVEVALDAMAQLKRIGSPITLQLIGPFETEEYRQQILARIEQLELHDVIQLTGFTQDVPAALRQLDALVLPSLFGEGMPMVVLEALSAGVPVVATRVEGTPEVVRNGIEGLLAQPGDAKDLADQIQRMTSCRSNWQHMSARALTRHRTHFSDTLLASRVAKAYERLI